MNVNRNQYYKLYEKYSDERYAKFVDNFINCAKKAKKENYVTVVEKLAEEFEEYHNANLTSYMNTYTIHDFSHSCKIIGYMSDLIVDFDLINTETYFYLMLAAICHDWGLLVSNDNVNEIMCNKYIQNQSNVYDWESTLFQMEMETKDKENAKRLAISMIARNLHTKSEIIEKKINELSHGSNFNVDEFQKKNIINICAAHGDDVEHIKKYRWEQAASKDDIVDFGYVVAMLRLCDLLDIGADRISNYTIEDVPGDSENKKHWYVNKLIRRVLVEYDGNANCVTIQNKYKGACHRCPKVIKFEFSDSNNYLMEDKMYDEAYSYLLEYIEYIEYEIKENIPQLLGLGMENRNLKATIQLKGKIERVHEIEDISFGKIRVEDSGIIDLITSESLYGDKKIAIREVLQNAFDACSARRQIVSKDEYKPYVEIRWDEERLTIYDNGIGMDEETIRRYFLVVGNSIYKSPQYMYSKEQFLHAGNFGIGVFSLFMLSDGFEVCTAKYGENQEEFSFFIGKGRSLVRITRRPAGEFRGTKISIKKSEDFKNIFKNQIDLSNYIKSTFFDYASLPKVVIKNDDKINQSEFSSFDFLYYEKYYEKGSDFIDLTKYLSGIMCYAKFSNTNGNILLYYDEKQGRFVNPRPNQDKEQVVIKEYDFGEIKLYCIIPKSVYNQYENVNNENKKVYNGYQEFAFSCDDIIFGECPIRDVMPDESWAKIKGQGKGCKYYAHYCDGLFYGEGGNSSQYKCDLRSSVKVFLHSILIEQADFDLKLAPFLDIKYVVFNILRNDVCPSIDRNKLDRTILYDLKMAFLTAILSYLIDDGHIQENSIYYQYKNFLEHLLQNQSNNKFIK